MARPFLKLNVARRLDSPPLPQAGEGNGNGYPAMPVFTTMAAALLLLLSLFLTLPAFAEQVRSAQANVRAEPHAQGRVITALPRGTRVEVLETSGRYARIRAEGSGLTGWVYAPTQGWASEPEADEMQLAPRPTETAAAPVAAVEAVLEPEAAPPPEPPVQKSALTKPEAAPPQKAPAPTAITPAAAPSAATAELQEMPVAPIPPATPAPPAPLPPPPATVRPAPASIPVSPAVAAARSPYFLSNGDASAIPVGELRLEMDPLDAEVLFRKDPYDESGFPVTLLDGGQRLKGKVAVKGSFSRHFLKKSLLITLDQGLSFDGHRHIALNAMATDPSQMREWLAWDLVRRLGFVGPQVEYRKLYLNGEYIGLYLDIEWMDAVMFERLGMGKGGSFYQPDDQAFCGDLSPLNLDRPGLCWSKITPGDNDYSELADLIRSLDAAPVDKFDAWLEQHFDTASVIDWLVLNALTQQGDTYNKNYFLYREAGSRWRVIPWDYDLAWGRVADVTLPFPKSIYNPFFQYSFPPNLGADNALKRKTLSNAALFARFIARMREVMLGTGETGKAAGWFEPQQFRKRLADLKQRVRPALEEERYWIHGVEDFDLHIDALAFFNEWRSLQLKGQMLDVSPFGGVRWLPYSEYEALSQLTEEQLRQRRRQSFGTVATARLESDGTRYPLADDVLGWPLAVAARRDGVTGQLGVEVRRETPPSDLPPGIETERCVERSWQVTVRGDAPLRVDLQFDYLQEATTRHELGSAIRDERALRLWQNDGQAWRVLPSHINPLANYLNVDALTLRPWVVNRFVACTE